MPEDFLFSVKASRYISHLKKLNVEKAILQQLFSRLSQLKDHLGPILFQLPPRWNQNTDRLHAFLSLLPKRYRYVFEFRNPSWYAPEVYSLLREYHCAFCIYELAGHLSPLEVTAGFVYLRLHGPGKKYEGSYSHETLRHWAKRCRLWNKSERRVCLF